MTALTLIGCSGRGQAEDRVPVTTVGESPDTTAKTDEILYAEDDFGVVYTNRAQVAAKKLSAEVTVDDGSDPALAHSAILRFPAGLGDPSCIATATLTLHFASVDTTSLVVVYPGRPETLAVADGERLVTLEMLIADQPRGVVDVEAGSDVVGTADITSLVQAWAAGGPFQSMLSHIDPAQPLTLVIRLQDQPGRDSFRVKMSESGEGTTPSLRIGRTC